MSPNRVAPRRNTSKQGTGGAVAVCTKFSVSPRDLSPTQVMYRRATTTMDTRAMQSIPADRSASAGATWALTGSHKVPALHWTRHTASKTGLGLHLGPARTYNIAAAEGSALGRSSLQSRTDVISGTLTAMCRLPNSPIRYVRTPAACALRARNAQASTAMLQPRGGARTPLWLVQEAGQPALGCAWPQNGNKQPFSAHQRI